MKMFLIVVTILLVIALGAVGYVWWLLQGLQTDSVPQAETTGLQQDIDEVSSTDEMPVPTVQEPVVIEMKDIPESQQEVLKTFGFEGESFTVTPTMVTCAESAVGKTRFDEIVGGAAPSPLESLKLLPCFKK